MPTYNTGISDSWSTTTINLRFNIDPDPRTVPESIFALESLGTEKIDKHRFLFAEIFTRNQKADSV